MHNGLLFLINNEDKNKVFTSKLDENFTIGNIQVLQDQSINDKKFS